MRPAPFPLTEGTVAALLGARSGAKIVAVPVLPVRLVDRPRPSADPMLASANDDTSLSEEGAHG